MVYAWLRAVRLEGGATVEEVAFQCFPTMHGADDPAYVALRKRGVRRVLDAVVWLRASGVVVRCVPEHVTGLSRYVVETPIASP
jgi:hypothetical protein